MAALALGAVGLLGPGAAGESSLTFAGAGVGGRGEKSRARSLSDCGAVCVTRSTARDRCRGPRAADSSGALAELAFERVARVAERSVFVDEESDEADPLDPLVSAAATAGRAIAAAPMPSATASAPMRPM
jgi:hypothetical protein